MIVAIALAILAAFVGSGVLFVLIVLSLTVQDWLDGYKQRKATTHSAAMRRVVEGQAQRQPR